jgi:PAS domain S-box-containing protein
MKSPLPDALKAEILDNVPVMIAFYDRDQKVVWGNRAYRKATGSSLQDLEGKPCHAVWGPTKPCRHGPVAKALETGEPHEAEWPPETQAGGPDTQGAWLSSAAPIKDGDGHIIGAVEAVYDIRARKQAEKALRERERHDRTLFETMAQGVVYQTATGEISAANPAAERILGLSLAQMRGKTSRDPAWQSLHEDGSPFLGEDHPAMVALRTGETVSGAIMGVYHPNSGEHRWLTIDAVPEFLPGETRPHRVSTTFTDITERKRAEESYQTLFREMLDGFALHEILCDARGQPVDYRFLAVNPAFERLTDLQAKDLLGKTLLEVLPGTEPHWIETYGRVALTGEPAFFESYARDLDKHFQVTAFRPAPHQFACIFADITARQRAEENLRVKDRAIETAINANAMGDLAGKLTYVNPAFLALWGYADSPEVLGKHLSEFWHFKADAERVLQVLQGDGGWIGELVAARKDGSSFEVQVSASLVTNDAGKPMAMLASFLDITERKRAEEEIRKFRTIADKATYGAAITGVDGHLIYVNETFARMHGWEPAELLGRHLSVFHRQDQMARVEALLERLLREGSFSAEEVWHAKRDGSAFPTLMNASLIEDAAGKSQFLSATVLDITERKRAEEEREQLQAQLAQARKMESVGRLAGGVAHDFNNMLAVITGHADLALEETDPESPLHADLLEIQKAARRSADLTRQLLAFARKQIIAPQVLDLNDTVAGLLPMLRRLIGEAIDVVWRPGAQPWTVQLDPSQVDQVLVNLVVNARDAIAGVGQVAIETENVAFDEAYCTEHAGFVPGEYVRLAVSDDGCGMDPETRAHLFEPFFTTKGVGQGTGLGLATLYGVVEQNQGFITVYSEPGQGTTFNLYLPRHRNQAPPAPIESPAEPARRGRETVLVVEDEPALLNLVGMMLDQLGYRVLAAGTPGEALRRAEAHAGEIHLLVTDLVMPEMNGRDLAERLLALRPNLKRLFMSGYTAGAITHHGVLDEGVQFVQKPFSMKALATKIREALERDRRAVPRTND